MGISEKKLNQLAKELESMGITATVKPYEKLTVSKILMRYREGIVFLALAISIIMYGHYVDSRLRDYSVFRISGIGKNRLKLLCLLENMSLFTIAYGIMTSLWFFVVLFVLKSGTYNFGKICTVGYIVLFIMYMLVSIPFFKRLDSKSTMELYRKSRRIG